MLADYGDGGGDEKVGSRFIVGVCNEKCHVGRIEHTVDRFQIR